MPKRIKVFLVLAAFIIGLFATTPSTKTAEAASFSVSYDVTYTFDDGGTAKVVQKISLKNLTADLYPSEYSLNIGTANVKNISGADSSGAISVTSDKKKKSTIFNARLNDKIIGKNKSTNFTLNYTISKLGTKKGRAWEVIVPGISTAEKLLSFNMKLIVPKKYGDLYSIYPNPDKKSANKNNYVYTFGKKKTPDETIVANFGKYQNIEFTFKHKLSNSNFFPKDEKIFLPPDTYFQEVNYTDISPRPDDIEVDTDGNYFAKYSLKGGEDKEIIVKGFAKIDKSISKGLSIPEGINKEVASTKYWESDSRSISEEAAKLTGINDIYDFVIKTLTYKKSGPDEKVNTRLGAKQALQKPKEALNSEFVDLFIALARAKNIPARQIVGFAFGDYTTATPTIVNADPGSKVLHTWVEYFDEDSQQWIQVDPTWGATRSINYLDRVDQNHFALIIRNKSSEEPKIPSIFTGNISNKDFDVKPTDKDFNFTSEPKIEIDADETISGFPTLGKVVITNDTGKSLRRAKINIETESVNIIGEKSQELGTILPFSQYTVSVKLRSSSVLNSSEDTLKVVLTGFDQGAEKSVTSEKNILVKPFFSFNTPQLLLLFLLLIVLGGLAVPFYKKLKIRLRR